jgi:tRNA(Ile)-lysidine synthase TilS/MesJ
VRGYPIQDREKEIVNTVASFARKAERLRQLLATHPRLIVAYSGGVDSAFLAGASSSRQPNARRGCRLSKLG